MDIRSLLHTMWFNKINDIFQLLGEEIHFIPRVIFQWETIDSSTCHFKMQGKPYIRNILESVRLAFAEVLICSL